MKKLQLILTIVFSALILILGIRGINGNPTDTTINLSFWNEDGPLELSPERGRFALTYSLIEDHSFSFSLPLARFVTPDLGYINGKYVSLFAPGVSYIIMPGYLLGKIFNMSQVGSYAVIALFALLNLLLIRAISLRLGASSLAAVVAGMVFLFATPAFAYSVSLYQHHISTFLILLAIYLLLKFKNIAILTLVWFLCAAALPIDYPNLVMLLPIGIFAMSRIFFIYKKDENYWFNAKVLGLLTFIGVIIPLLFFVWFNQQSYNNPFQLAGTVQGVDEIDAEGKPTIPLLERQQDLKKVPKVEEEKKSTLKFFQTRGILTGLASLFINRDRGMIWFAPILLLSVFGMKRIYKKNPVATALFLAIIGANILLYSMWGDPQGGWAFGSRYLIPSYAMLSIFLAFALSAYRRNLLFMTAFILLLTISVSVNTLGAITSNRNPPKDEILGLEELTGQEEKYGYDRNYQLLEHNTSKSYIFQTYAIYYMSALQYYYLIVGAISCGFACAILALVIKKEQHL